MMESITNKLCIYYAEVQKKYKGGKEFLSCLFAFFF
jgi:hypothetical protein